MLANRVAKGAAWLVGARLATKTLDMVSMLIVARLLVPADFGLFALAATVLLVMEAMTDLSLSNAIVQMHEPPDEVYDTAFTLNLVRGLIVSVTLCVIASPFAQSYGDPRLAPIVLALAITPLLRGLVSPKMALLQRHLNFRPSFYLEATGKLAAFAASVGVALLTKSYWALVAGMIAAPAISTILSYLFAPYRPAFGLREWKPIFIFSGWLTLSNTINTLNWQADRLFIGGQLGPSVLGNYTVGSELAMLPTHAPVLPIMQALYAGFARLSQNLPHLRASYLLSQCMVVAIALPIAISVSVFAFPIVYLAIGPDWNASAQVVQILAPVFALQMLTAPAQSIAMVRGRTDSIFARDLVSFAVRLPLILVGMYFAGLEGVIYARVASGLFAILLNLRLMSRLLDVTILEQIMAPWRSYVSGIVLATTLAFSGAHFNLLHAIAARQLPELVAVVLAGLFVYGAVHLALWAIARPAVSAEQKGFDLIRSSIRPSVERI